MAEIVQTKGGRRLDDYIVNLPGVRRATLEFAQEIEADAKVNLAEHRAQGESSIRLDKGGPGEYHVVLSDEPLGPGFDAVSGRTPGALNIEFGRSGHAGNGYMEPLFILSGAVRSVKRRSKYIVRRLA